MTSSTPRHESLHLKDFTIFAEARFDFVPGINVLVGVNEVGKTHVLKVMFAWQAHQAVKHLNDWLTTVSAVFQVPDQAQLVRIQSETQKAELAGVYSGREWSEACYKTFTNDGKTYNDYSASTFTWGSPKVTRPVFIPSGDMLGHTLGFTSIYDEFKIDFDVVSRDIVSLMLSPTLKNLDSSSASMVDSLEKAIGGRVELEGERFYLRTEETRLEMPLLGAGTRRIATLVRLIQCGWLRPGATLFWDEPDIHLHPKIMGGLVEVLLTLSSNGVQILLATHSAALLKELDRQRFTSDSFRYFYLQPGPEGTRVEAFDDLDSLGFS